MTAETTGDWSDVNQPHRGATENDMPRPQLDDKKRLTATVQSRLTAGELAALEKELKGLSASAWIRETIMARLKRVKR
jgi:hypothetical protein